MSDALSNKFRFIFGGNSNLTFENEIISINIPGVNLGVINEAQRERIIYYSGDSLDYNDLTITLRLDKKLSSYVYFYNYILTLRDNEDPVFKNIFQNSTLQILDKKSLPVIDIIFGNIFPYTISDIQLDVKDVTKITYDVTFKVNDMSILEA